MSSDRKSNRALRQPKLLTQNRVLGQVRFFVNHSNSNNDSVTQIGIEEIMTVLVK